MKTINIIIAITFLAVGFVSAYLVLSATADNKAAVDTASLNDDSETAIFVNPFSTKAPETTDNARLNSLENDVADIMQQLQNIELTLQNLAAETETGSSATRQSSSRSNRFTSALSQRLYNLDNLIRGGIDPSIAEDIVRRKNKIELERLELQDRARREDYLDTERYFDELEAINSQDISLREELGDQQYDEYLFNSKQNNRIKITSVMLGSVAEQAGIEAGDVVLSYDSQRMYTWQELKDATAEGQLGEYVSISMSRSGEIFSFTVPRGPLGVQLGATRLIP